MSIFGLSSMSLVFYFWDLIQEVFTDISALGKLVFLVVFTGFCGSSDTNLTKTFFYIMVTSRCIEPPEVLELRMKGGKIGSLDAEKLHYLSLNFFDDSDFGGANRADRPLARQQVRNWWFGFQGHRAKVDPVGNGSSSGSCCSPWKVRPVETRSVLP